MGNRRIGRETALQFLFSRDLNDNPGPEDTESFFALRVAKQSSFTAQDIREDQYRPENPNSGDYLHCAVITFRTPQQLPTSKLKIKPLAGQGLPDHLRVECAREMLTKHAEGTIFKIQAKLTNSEGTATFLDSLRSAPYEVLSPEEAKSFISNNDSLALHTGMGSDTIRRILASTDLHGLIKKLEKILNRTTSKKLRKKITKRLKITKDFSTNQKFAEKLVHGIIQHQVEIDKQLVDHLENFTLPRLSTIDRNVLRLAIYEMFYCDDVPPIVAINEAIELAKRFGTEESGGFVNGVLDRLKDQLTRSLRD
jgi:N utilization substance protein B